MAREFVDAGLRDEPDLVGDRRDKGRWGVPYAVDVSLDEPDKERQRELSQAAAAMKAVLGPRIGRLAPELEHAPLEPSHVDDD